VDEVQTGLGRTGKVLAIHHEGVKPDGIILASAGRRAHARVGVLRARVGEGVFKPATMQHLREATRWGAAIASNAERPPRREASERAAVMGEYLLKRLKATRAP